MGRAGKGHSTRSFTLKISLLCSPRVDNYYNYYNYKMNNRAPTLQTSHSLRLLILHRTITLRQNANRVAINLKLKYVTIRHIMLTYLRTGRTNKIKKMRSLKVSQALGRRTKASSLSSVKKSLKKAKEKGINAKKRKGKEPGEPGKGRKLKILNR